MLLTKLHPRRIWQHLRQPGTFIRHVGMTMSANVIITLCGVVSGLLVARLLSPEGRGELAAIQSWSLLLASLALLGLSDSVVYWGSRDVDQLGRYITSALALIAVSGTCLASVGWMFMPVLLWAQSPAIVEAARLCLVGMVANHSLFSLLVHTLRVTGHWRTWNILRVLPRFGWVAGLLTAPLLFRTPDAINLNWLFLATHLVLVIPTVVIVRYVCTGPYQIDHRTFRPLLNYGIPAALQVLPQTLNLRFDQMLMASLLDPRALGLYTIGVLWSSATAPLMSAIAPVLFPRLSSLHSATEQHKLIRNTMIASGATNALLTITMLMVTPFALPILFGQAYAEAIPATLILIVAAAVSNLNLNLIAALRGLGQPRESLNAELVGLMITAVALAALLRPAGIIGAAVASLLAYSTTCAYLAFALRRVTRAPGNTSTTL